MIDLVEDFIDTLGPDKRFGILIVGFDVILNRFNQVFDAFEDAPTNPFSGDLAKPSFHQI